LLLVRDLGDKLRPGPVNLGLFNNTLKKGAGELVVLISLGMSMKRARGQGKDPSSGKILFYGCHAHLTIEIFNLFSVKPHHLLFCGAAG